MAWKNNRITTIGIKDTTRQKLEEFRKNYINIKNWDELLLSMIKTIEDLIGNQ